MTIIRSYTGFYNNKIGFFSNIKKQRLKKQKKDDDWPDCKKKFASRILKALVNQVSPCN